MNLQNYSFAELLDMQQNAIDIEDFQLSNDIEVELNLQFEHSNISNYMNRDGSMV